MIVFGIEGFVGRLERTILPTSRESSRSKQTWAVGVVYDFAILADQQGVTHLAFELISSSQPHLFVSLRPSDRGSGSDPLDSEQRTPSQLAEAGEPSAPLT